jgi:hypothetical protein
MQYCNIIRDISNDYKFSTCIEISKLWHQSSLAGLLYYLCVTFSHKPICPLPNTENNFLPKIGVMARFPVVPYL